MLRLASTLLLAISASQGLRLPVGTPIPQVVCAADAAQSYALYLPSNYSEDRAWPVIFGFDPGGRGANPVDRYQAAAEQYGYIVVGSNNSRNGSVEAAKVVTVLTSDVLSRFRVDSRRVYTAGMSGGARVALGVALGSGAIAGVIASSAGYPDSQPRKTLAFPVFMTAGTEDFNHLEMRIVDRDLTSPHHLAIFEGGHTWLSSQLAMEAVEWMEVQAMKSGAAPRNEAELDRILAKRVAGADAAGGDAATYLALQSLAADFKGLRDVAGIASRAEALGREKTVRAALKHDRDEDEREVQMLSDVRSAEARLGAEEGRISTLAELRQRWKELAERAKKPADSPERRLARRVLSNLSASVTSTDAEYLKIIAEYRLGRGGR
jgi:poly(3-hydroxybutyrate) depolymerase